MRFLGPDWSQLALDVAESDHTLGGSPDPERGGTLVRSKLLTANYGPSFKGLVARTAAGFVCVAPPTYEQDSCVQAIVRELVLKEGGDCDTCRGCPIGRLHN